MDITEEQLEKLASELFAKIMLFWAHRATDSNVMMSTLCLLIVVETKNQDDWKTKSPECVFYRLH